MDDYRLGLAPCVHSAHRVLDVYAQLIPMLEKKDQSVSSVLIVVGTAFIVEQDGLH